MSYILAVVGPINAATRIYKELRKRGCKSIEVIHTPSSINSGGCSYSVRFSETYLDEFNSLLYDGRYKIKGLFREKMSDDGSVYYDIS